MNSTTREMISDIFLTNSFSKRSKISFLSWWQIFTNNSNNNKSLFTNVPLGETIDIVADTHNDVLDKPVLSLNKNFFKALLELSVRDVLFFFNNVLYSQINSVGMGNPLGPTLTNAFLCHHEIKWLDNNCPPDFKLIFSWLLKFSA